MMTDEDIKPFHGESYIYIYEVMALSLSSKTTTHSLGLFCLDSCFGFASFSLSKLEALVFPFFPPLIKTGLGHICIKIIARLCVFMIISSSFFSQVK